MLMRVPRRAGMAAFERTCSPVRQDEIGDTAAVTRQDRTRAPEPSHRTTTPSPYEHAPNGMSLRTEDRYRAFDSGAAGRTWVVSAG